MTKEERRRQEALRKQKKANAVKAAVVALGVSTLALIGYLVAIG